jgi:hypothetical protein
MDKMMIEWTNELNEVMGLGFGILYRMVGF